MIRFLSINDPYRLLVVLALMAVLGIYAHSRLPEATIPEIRGMITGEMMGENKLIYVRVMDSTPPVTALINRAIVEVAGRNLGIRHTLTIAVFFLQAVVFGLLLINNRAFEQQTYLPPFLYGVLLFFSLDSIAFTREVWSSAFLVLAIDRVFRQLQFREQQDANLQVLGLFVGLSSLCAFSYTVFFPGILLILATTTRLDLRQVLLYTTGFMLPHLIVMTIYASIDRFPELWANFYLTNFEFNTRTFMDLKSLLLLSVVPLTYLVLSLLMSARNTRFTRYQSQIFNVMFIWLVFGVVEVWLSRNRTAQSLVVCIPPIAYFITHYLSRIRRRWLAETMLWIFIGGLLTVSSLAMQGRISPISYAQTFAGNANSDLQEKKLLVLSPDLAVYRNNKAAGFFPEWAVTEQIFKDPGYYENIVTVYNAFQVDPPDVIIDPEQLMTEMFRHMPDVAKRYKKVGERYVRVGS